MLIDWFTVFAQLVNFLILMALLKRFLYKPIIRALEGREKKIADRLEEAKKIKADAERELEEYVYRNELFEQQRADLLKQARNDADHEREKLIEAARTEAAALRADWKQALQIEQRSLHREIMKHTREEVFAISRKTLKDLASESLEGRMSEVFMRRLRTLDESEKNLLTLAIQASSKPVLVCSAFELDLEQQSALKKTIRDVFEAEAAIEFQTDTEQISGIELSTNGHKLAWHIADYLTAFERRIESVLQSKTVALAETGEDVHGAG